MRRSLRRTRASTAGETEAGKPLHVFLLSPFGHEPERGFLDAPSSARRVYAVKVRCPPEQGRDHPATGKSEKGNDFDGGSR